MSPLHFAARAGSLDIACLLLDAGADAVRPNLRRYYIYENTLVATSWCSTE